MMRCWGHFWSVSYNHVACFTLKVETFLISPASRPENVRDQFAQRCKQKMEVDPCFLERIVFFDECLFLLHGAVNKENCRIWASEGPEAVYKSRQSFPTSMVSCIIFKTGIVRSYFFEDGSVTGERYKRIVQYFLFSKPAKLPFQHDFPAGWSSAALYSYSKTILRPQACKQVDGEGASISVPSWISWLDSCDFLL